MFDQGARLKSLLNVLYTRFLPASLTLRFEVRSLTNLAYASG
jgi:hypothetical protein